MEPQFYIGVKRVYAFPEKGKDGSDGYAVIYRHGEDDAYRSWSPKAEFEKFYYPMGVGNKDEITPAMIGGMIKPDNGAPGKLAVLLTKTAINSRAMDAEDTRLETGDLLNFVLDWAEYGVLG